MSASLRLCLVAAIGAMVLQGCEAVRELQRSEALRLCSDKIGQKPSDISSYRMRNENCLIDCITNAAVMNSYLVNEGESCGPDVEWVCKFGRCRDRNELVDKEELYLVNITIESAHVPDMDSIPGTGASDTFVLATIKDNGSPVYGNREQICYTHVVQDSEFPRFDYTCNPGPIKKEALIEFRAFDSDRPSNVQDLLGSVSERIETLLNKGSRRLRLSGGGSGESADFYVMVNVSGAQYTGSS